MDLLNSILTGGIGVAIFGLFGQVLIWYLNNKNSLTVKNIEIKSIDVENLPTVQSIINRVIDETSIQRVLIMKTENGGGKPRLGAHLYTSIMYDAFKSPLYGTKNDYQRMLVDDIYVKMLSDIGPTTYNNLSVGKMKDGLLKRVYLRDGIKYSEVYYVTETDDAFVYVTFSSTDENEKFDNPNDRVEIDIAVSKIRNIFEPHKQTT
jgi:hypothetical protein